MDEEILALAMELGDVRPGEEQGLLVCCRMAMEELAGMLKPGVTPLECAVSFKASAARLALGDWLALRKNLQPRKFSAGELTVERGEDEPGELRRQALRQMARWLVDPAFFLREVKG